MEVPMTMGRWTACAVALLGAGLGIARADVNGSYDGQVSGPKVPTPVAAAAALSQNGKLLTGTVAMAGDPLTAFGGAYLVSGKATPKKVKASGFSPTGVRLKWTGKIVGEVVQGKATFKAPGRKLVGTLALTRNAVTGDGSGCDAVYTQNSTLFTTQVLAQALLPCLSCHVSGGQAGATRLRLDTADPLASARSVALQVDSANPLQSRLLLKPTGMLPHGGDTQITAGSTGEATLKQWIGLVAQAACN
jgi:hypothetical protein